MSVSYADKNDIVTDNADYSCNHVLFKASHIKKYSLKAINSDLLESCRYHNKLVKSHYLIIYKHLEICTCIETDVLNKLKNNVTEEKQSSLLSCINKSYDTLKWLDKAIENIISCRELD